MWAIRLLRRKQKLISMGVFDVVTEFDFEKNYYHTRGLNEMSQAWLDRAFVDLSGLKFIAGDNYNNNAKARKRLDVEYAKTRIVPVCGLNIDFRNFIFPGDVRFNNTDFEGIALFNGATFHATGWFSDARFHDACWFKDAEFREHASFHQAAFGSYTTFEASRFKSVANFEAITAAKTFSLRDANFTNEVPSFVDATFSQTPRIDNLEVLAAPKRTIFTPRIRSTIKAFSKESRKRRKFILRDLYWTEWLFNRAKHSYKLITNARRNRDDELNFRSLKRLANEAGDQQRERAFYAGQVRARRHIKDKIKNVPTGLMRYLFGAGYELTTNFGRSLTRPVLCWVAVFYAFSYIYLASSPVFYLSKCQDDIALSPYEAAKTISLNNALMFMAEHQTEAVSEAHTCLNSTIQIEKKYQRKIVMQPKDQTRLLRLEDDDELITGSTTGSLESSSFEDPFADYRPPEVSRNNISVMAYTQLSLHLLLIALFLFVLRNHFRMR